MDRQSGCRTGPARRASRQRGVQANAAVAADALGEMSWWRPDRNSPDLDRFPRGACRARKPGPSKLYLADPLLAWLGHRLRAGLPEPTMPSLTEMALSTAMAVAIDNGEPGRWMGGDTIGYVRTGAGNEVDLGPVPVPAGGRVERTTPLEAKWVSQGWRSEARVVEGKYGYGVLATKNITDTATPAWAVPAPVVALMLN